MKDQRSDRTYVIALCIYILFATPKRVGHNTKQVLATLNSALNCSAVLKKAISGLRMMTGYLRLLPDDCFIRLFTLTRAYIAAIVRIKPLKQIILT